MYMYLNKAVFACCSDMDALEAADACWSMKGPSCRCAEIEIIGMISALTS